MSRMWRSILLAMAVIGLSGCCCLRDDRGPSNVCEVHHVAMESTTVPGWGGCKLPTRTYANARSNLFPNTYPHQLNSPWPWKRERVYICAECVEAQKRWEDEQEQANKHLQPIPR
jgi:hypothetical protein